MNRHRAIHAIDWRTQPRRTRSAKKHQQPLANAVAPRASSPQPGPLSQKIRLTRCATPHSLVYAKLDFNHTGGAILTRLATHRHHLPRKDNACLV